MPSIGQENLETVMIDFFGALRRGDFEAAAGLLDPDVSWQGLREEWVCHGREEVIDTFRWGLEQRREVDALEFTRGGEQVVLGARGHLSGFDIPRASATRTSRQVCWRPALRWRASPRSSVDRAAVLESAERWRDP
jgi:hypothetical protein